jgi:hypothetical protein
LQLLSENSARAGTPACRPTAGAKLRHQGTEGSHKTDKSRRDGAGRRIDHVQGDNAGHEHAANWGGPAPARLSSTSATTATHPPHRGRPRRPHGHEQPADHDLVNNHQIGQPRHRPRPPARRQPAHRPRPGRQRRPGVRRQLGRAGAGPLDPAHRPRHSHRRPPRRAQPGRRHGHAAA